MGKSFFVLILRNDVPFLSYFLQLFSDISSISRPFKATDILYCSFFNNFSKCGTNDVLYIANNGS